MEIIKLFIYFGEDLRKFFEVLWWQTLTLLVNADYVFKWNHLN